MNNNKRKLEADNMNAEQQAGNESCLEELELPLPNSFKLENVVCNHGFFMMAPNRWIPKIKTLQRPLRLSDSTSVMVYISQSYSNFLSIRVYHHDRLKSDDKQTILLQVKRMLRLSRKEENAVNEFQTLHPTAKTRGFGRLFHAPTLFEDIVKCILLCNTRFSRTLQMAKKLCQIQHLLPRENFKAADLNDKDGMEMGNFPNVEEIIHIGDKKLKTTCRLGYRAHTILQFAKRVKDGRIKLEHEEEEGFPEELREKLMKIKGIGSFVCDSVMMCIGAYNWVPQDTETIRLLQEVHGKGRGTELRSQEEMIGDVYGPYKPFQCLAFWLEMVESYERVFGKLSELSTSKYGNVGGNGIAFKRGKVQLKKQQQPYIRESLLDYSRAGKRHNTLRC